MKKSTPHRWMILGLLISLLWLLALPTHPALAQIERDFSPPLPFLYPIGYVDDPTTTGAFAVVGDYLYHIDDLGELRIIHIADPTQMAEIGAFGVASRVTALALDGDQAYIGDQDGILTRFDVSDPAQPRPIGTFTGRDLGIGEDLTTITSLTMAGERMLLVADARGMHVIDISQPSAAQSVGFYALDNIHSMQSGEASISILGHGNGAGVELIDLSDPVHPTRLDLLDRFARIGAFAAAHGYLYVATNDTTQSLFRNTQLWIIDMTSAGAPNFVLQESARYRDQVTVTGHTAAGQMATAGSLLYLSTDAGLTVFDVADPRRPLQIEHRPTAYGEPPYPVMQPQSGDGRTFFLGTEDGALVALRSRTPFVPTPNVALEVAGHLGGESHALVVEDGWAYMSNGPEISLLDLSQPATPQRVGYYLDADVGDGGRDRRILAMESDDTRIDRKIAYVLETWQLRILEIPDPTAVGACVSSSRCTPRIVSSLPHGNRNGEVPGDDTTVGSVRNDPIVRAERRSGNALTWAGDYLYLLLADCWRPGSHEVCEDFLRIVDVEDPAATRVVADVSLFDAHYQLLGGQQIVVADGRAYISSNQGLRILDISDPTAPRVLYQNQADGRYSSSWLAVDGTRLYLLHWAGHLRVLDVSDPANLVELADHSWTGGATGILLHEEFLYVAGYEATPIEAGFARTYGWFVFDRAGGDAPESLGFFPADGEITAMVIEQTDSQETLLYLTTANGLSVVDVTEPRQPQMVGVYRAPAHMADLHVQTGLAAIAGGYSDPLHIVDVRRPVFPEVVSQGTTVQNDTVQGSLLAQVGATVLVAKEERLQVVDVANPTAPQAVDSFSAPGAIKGMALGSARAYLYWENWRNEEAGVQIIDVRQPSNDSALMAEGLLSIPYTNTNAVRLGLYGNLLYLLLGKGGLYTIDVSDPAAPMVLVEPFPFLGEDLVVGSGFAYLSSALASDPVSNPDADSLQILNLTNAARPQAQAQVGLGLLGRVWRAKRMALQGDLLYVADDSVGLRVVDISIPIAPVEAGQISVPDLIRDIAVAGDYLYVTTYNSGLFVYKVTVADRPELSAVSPTPEFSRDGVIVGQQANDGALLHSTDGGVHWSAWSPPLAYVADAGDAVDDNGNREIYVADAQGENALRLTAHMAADETPAWSPGWSHIVFASQRSGNWDLYSLRVDCAPDRPRAALGCELRQLTTDPADDLLPAWSPDGRQIAFVSLRDGNPEIYVMQSDGTQPRRVTYDPSGDWRPAWLPNSREIVYTSGRLGNNDLFRLDLSHIPGAGEAAAQPVALVTGSADERDPALSDGRALLFVSDRNGFPRVYQMEMEEAGAADAVIRPLAATGEAEEQAEGHPAWTADNQVLVTRTVGEETHIYRVAEGAYDLLLVGHPFSGHPAAMPVWWIPR